MALGGLQRERARCLRCLALSRIGRSIILKPRITVIEIACKRTRELADAFRISRVKL